MTGGLIFIAGLIVGGCIAVMLLGCLQINRINKYESTINKLHTLTAEKKSSQRRGLIIWSDGAYQPGDGNQDTVTFGQQVDDPVKGYINLMVSYGGAKIVKVSEDGKVDGITFRIQGNGIDKTVKTANGGVFQLDNLKPGAYNVA